MLGSFTEHIISITVNMEDSQYGVVVFTEVASIAVVCKHWLFENVCPTNILKMFLLGHIGLK